jgi:hypothetical protein
LTGASTTLCVVCGLVIIAPKPRQTTHAGDCRRKRDRELALEGRMRRIDRDRERLVMPGGPVDGNFLRYLAAEHHRPLETLVALAGGGDPFTAGDGYRLRNAQWLVGLWRALDLPAGIHTRRVHYRLVSLATPPQRPDGRPYENTRACSELVGNAVRDAIYLGLLPGGAIVDNKNPAPVEFLVGPGEPARVNLPDAIYSSRELGSYEIRDYELPELPSLPELPTLPMVYLTRPKIAPRYHVEIWCEKSTVNDVLVPLGQRHGVNIATATGEFSATACRNLVDRAEESGRAVRILYVSDFDPSGFGMPVAVARKIEFELQKRNRGYLDIQVRPVALTHEQCTDWNLPRTPTKDTDSRAAGFEDRFGEGATELDALEAIYPGRLAEILTAEIRRYAADPTLDARVDEVAIDLGIELHRLSRKVASDYEPQMQPLEAEREVIAQELDEIHQEFRHEIERLVAEFHEKVRPLWERAAPIWDLAKVVWTAARVSLEAEMPDLDAVEWPVAAIGDEDPDPIFDSRRTYIEQIDRYKAHQGKPTSRRPSGTRLRRSRAR